MDEYEQLKQTMAALEAQRGVLGAAVVDVALASLRDKLAALKAQGVAAGQQRKTVSVLFLDVVGSTHMGQHLDPEEIMGIIDGALRRLTRVIEQHGGQVRSYQGDGFMALFGYPMAREDDAERAVRAGLALLEETRTYAPEVEANWGYHGFNIRVGINSGGVILGGGVDRDTSALGMTTNLAARVQTAAPAGGLLITHDTYRYVRGVFDVAPQPPLRVKGSDEPLQSYLVLRAKPRAFRMATRGVEGVETRMIGRDADLQALQASYREAIEGRQTRLVTIVGEAGVGKSRLLSEFINWMELRPERVYTLVGRATPGTQAVPYSLLRDMLAYRFEILENDTAAMALAKLRQGMAGLLEPEKADLVGQLVGFDFGGVSPYVAALSGSDSLAQLARTYFGEFLRGLVDRRPTVVLLEDVHWADDSSLDLLQVVDQMPEAALLVVSLARPEFFERRPNWGAGQPAWRRIDLQPLSPEVSGQLVSEILKKMPELPATLRELIVENAEGNPYYVEELVKMLIDDRIIITGGDQPDGERLVAAGDDQSVWRVDSTRLRQVKVPPTLAGILQARMDGLPPQEKAVLQRASVVGRLFWDQPVAELAADVAQPDEVRRLLAAARRHELVFARDFSRFAGSGEFIFKHAILRDVTYETVLLRLRPRYHGQVAAWLEAHAGERMGEFLHLIAGHYEAAGNWLRAAEYLSRAGEQSLRVSAFRDARAAFESALRLLQAGTTTSARQGADQPRTSGEGERRPADNAVLELRACLLVDLGRALTQLGEYQAAGERLAEALPLARGVGDRQGQVGALVVLAELDNRQGNYASAEVHLQAALALARPSADRAGLALVTLKLGGITRGRGQYAEATRWAEESRTLYAALSDRQGAAAAYKTLGMVARDIGDFEAAVHYQEQSLELSRQIGDRLGVAGALNNLGVVALAKGNYAGVHSYFEQYRAIATEIGDRWGAAVAAVNIGEAYLEEHQDQPARHYLRLALQEATAIQDVPGCLYVLADIARLLVGSGQAQRAGELLGLAMNHPATDSEIGQAAQAALTTLRAFLPADEVEAALERGKELNLAQTIEEIMKNAW